MRTSKPLSVLLTEQGWCWMPEASERDLLRRAVIEGDLRNNSWANHPELGGTRGQLQFWLDGTLQAHAYARTTICWLRTQLREIREAEDA